jgi:amino acid adenylation domain-containing protein
MEQFVTSLSLAESLRHAATSDKHITFVRGGTDHTIISYNTLYNEALSLCKGLYQLGFQENDELIIVFNDNELLLKVFWACILGKITAIPIASGSQDIHKQKIARIIAQMKRPGIICDTAYFGELESYLDKSSQTDLKNKLRGINIADLSPVNADFTLPVLHPDDIAYIQYSSGSTGDPKGVILTHRNLLSNTRAIAGRLAISDRDIALAWLPLTHDMGMICFHLTSVISKCHQVIIPTTLFIKRPLLWMELAGKFGATLLYSPNFGFQYLMTAIQSNADAQLQWQLQTVRVIVNGAEPISESITRKFLELLHRWGMAGDVVFPGYGLAEASVAVTLPDPGQQLGFVYCRRTHLQTGLEVQMLEQGDREGLSFAVCGYPVADCKLRITGDDDNTLPDMHVGNIQVKGLNVTAGYYRRPELTDVFTNDGWLRTGDLGFLYNGHLVVTGRKKNIIIINGQNYYPHDIEQLIENELHIRPGSVVACSVSDGEGQQQLAVFILFKGDMVAFYQQYQLIRSLIISGIGIYPGFILPVRSIPKTTSGKVMHYQLVEDFRKGVFEKEISALNLLEESTRTVLADKEETLSQILKEAGFPQHINPEDSLFRIGMNSLQALALINAFKQYGYDISFSTLYEADTPAQLLTLMQQSSHEAFADFVRLPETDAYPLSWGQQQIYVANLLAPASPRFNITFYTTIKGPLDEDRLIRAWNLLLSRYEILRSNIVWADDRPLQVTNRAQKPAIDCEDLRNEPHAHQLFMERMQVIAATPFIPEQDTLHRFYLARLETSLYMLGISLHHIIADGWSIRLIGRELGRIYTSLAAGETPDAPPAFQYRDFVHWQSQLHKSRQFQHNQAFWEEYLSGSLPQTAFPASIRGGNEQYGEQSNGAVYTKIYGKEITERISALTQEYGCTFFSALVAALGVLLRKYNYDEGHDLLLGTDTIGRTHPQLNDQIGYFLNVLPVRLGITEEMSFADLLRITHRNLLQVFDHQTYPIDTIMSRKQQSGQFSVYNVLVLFQNFSEPLGFGDIIPGLDMHTTEIENDTCLNDLLFEFLLKEGQLILKAKYNTSLYDKSYIADLCRHLEIVFEQIIAAPQSAVKNTILLTSAEKTGLLRALDTNTVQWPFSYGDLVTGFEQQVLKYPLNTALISADLTLSYQELNERANQVADWLRNVYAIRSNDLVGICTGRNECLVIGILAILKAGAAYVPIDPEYPAARVRYIIDNSRIHLLLTDRALNGDELQTHILPVYDSELFAGYNAENSTLVPQATDLAYVIYTSGSTGQPKGVMVKHSSVFNYTQGFATYFNITPEDRVIVQASAAFDTMVEEIFPALLRGSALIMAPHGGRDVEALSLLIKEKKATVLSTTPLVLNELNNLPDIPDSLRLIISGGDELQAAHIDRLIRHIPVYNTYGPTETTVCATYHPVSAIGDAGIIGKAVANAQVFIMDPQMELLPAGVAGEICIGGAGIAAGYLNNEMLTKERFIPHPFTTGTLYRTGDMGRLNTDGNIEFLGRRDHQVKIRGYRIEFGEIENTLLSSGMVNKVALNIVTTGKQKALAAYYTADTQLPAAALRDFLQSRLPLYMVPAYFIQLDHLPLTASGKIDRKVLQLPQLQPQLYTPPKTEVEQTIARIWQDILVLEQVGLEDNFFEIGGHSLKAVQVISRILRELSVKLDLRDLFVHPVLSQLSEMVEVRLWFNTPIETDLASNSDEIII